MDLVHLMNVTGIGRGQPLAYILSAKDSTNIIHGNHKSIANDAGSGLSATRLVLSRLVSCDEAREIESGFIINPETIPAENQYAAIKAWDAA